MDVAAVNEVDEVAVDDVDVMIFLNISDEEKLHEHFGRENVVANSYKVF